VKLANLSNSKLFLSIILSALGYTLIEMSYLDKRSEIDSGWREKLIGEIGTLQGHLKDTSLDDAARKEIEMQLKIDQFRLDHEIMPSDWRYREITTYFSLASDPEPSSQDGATEILGYILTDDWQAFYRMGEVEYKSALENYAANTFQYIEAKIYLAENELRYQYDIKPIYNNWKHKMADELTDNRIKIIMSEMFFADEDLRLSDAEVENLTTRNTIILYRIQHNYPEIKRKTLPYSMNATVDIALLVSVFMIVLTALCITNEYNYGTILQLFSYPFKRFKIILAKMVALVSIALGLLVLLYTVSILFGGLFFGFDVSGPYLFQSNGSIFEINYYVYVLAKYALSFIEVLVYISIAMTVSVLTRNAAVTIGLVTLPAILAKPILETLTIDYKLNNLNLIPFASFDLNQFLDNDLMVSGLTLPLAIAMTILTLLIMNAITFAHVRKQDL
jgi:ABC-2 type transport system permease protein